MDDSLFRKVSLERLSSPEQIDQLMKIRSPSGWLVVLAALVLLGMGCLWLVLGKIPVTVPCGGTVMPVSGLAEVQVERIMAVEHVYVRLGDLVSEGEVLAEGSYPVKAPCGGTITDVYVREGAVVMPGDTLVRIEPVTGNDASSLCAVLFISVDDGVRLRGGEEAFISPAGISLDRYGYIRGRVASVGRYPEGDSGRVAVRVSFTPAAGNGGLDYTYGRSPQESPHGGTPCTGYILLGHIRPAELVLPWAARN